MPLKVAKFGGTSLADAAAILRVREIVLADATRRIIVPSAPGKRRNEDVKVTDLLLKSAEELEKSEKSESLCDVKKRFLDIAEPLSLSFRESLFDEIADEYLKHKNLSYLLSRGEYLMGKLLAELLGFSFVDAADVIFFDENGLPDTKKIRENVSRILQNCDKIVVPGFYGTDVDGLVKTFSRGGSDITGALLAEAANAALYENFTDVPGVFSASPRIVASPRKIPYLSYRELRALSCLGASVLHEDAVFAVRRAKIPIRISNTFHPEEGGTTVSGDEKLLRGGGAVLGLSGKDGYSLLILRRLYGREAETEQNRFFKTLSESGFKTEHISLSTDTLSLCLYGGEKRLSDSVVLPENAVICREGLSLLSVVGDPALSVMATIFKTLGKTTPEVLFAEKSPDGLNFYICVPSDYLSIVIRALYDVLF